MKTAIASNGKDKNSDISDQAGRARYYLVFDASGKILEVIDNPFRTGGGGAGYGVAKMLADKGVGAIVAGDFGPKMIDAMGQRNLQYSTASGKVGDYAQGALKKSAKQ